MRKITLNPVNVSNIICMHKIGMTDDEIVGHINSVQIAAEMRRRIARLEWKLLDQEQSIQQNKNRHNLDGVDFL